MSHCTSPPTALEGSENMNQALPLFTKSTVMPRVIAADNSLHLQAGNAVKKKCAICIACHAKFSGYIFFRFYSDTKTCRLEPSLSAVMWGGYALCVHTCMPMLQSQSELVFIICYKSFLWFDPTVKSHDCSVPDIILSEMSAWKFTQDLSLWAFWSIFFYSDK